MKTSTIKKIIISFIGLILLYLIISFFMNMKWIKSQNWLDFSGNILGSLLGVLGAYLILQYQLKVDQKKSKIIQIDNTFFNMLDLFQKVQDKVQSETFVVSMNNSDELLQNFFSGFEVSEETLKKNSNVEVDVFNKIIFEIYKNKREFLTKKKELYVQKLFEEQDQGLLDEINGVIDGIIEYGYDDYVFMSYDGSYKGFLDIKNTTEKKSYFEYKMGVNEITKFIKTKGDYYLSSDRKSKLNKVVKLVSDLNSKQEEYDYVIQEEDILIIVDKVFSNYHPNIGNYLRVFHRLVKQIMSSQLETKKKKEYLGIIRALLSSAELLVVFYNSFYSIRGEGLKKQLNWTDNNGTKTEFFADKRDIEKFDVDSNGKIDLPFFKYQNLVFKENDLTKIKSLINDN